ncbi:hypothetical protein O6H91_05G025400 [Diphasiastrum complanatum]|uniref:Uncharacterized protein n=2 Tax=Diphasiastrum complanatum TaxID=34168 RepID=A0ACC2DLU5_DIPCM|nr:hypothetical protein O6H91_05G025400 [Diphasiastrum complanatum]KAJ7555185.1 hypothetical protein O6H91_05G025400 [Diphasiastrum complanatum]
MTLSLRERSPTFDELNGLLLQEELQRQNLMSREDFKELGFFTKNQGKKGKKDQKQEGKDNSEKLDAKSNPKRNNNCNFCGKYGHFAFECRKKMAIQDKKKQLGNFTEDEDKSKAAGCYELFSASTSENSNDCWYIDSRATQHMTPHREWFTQFDDSDVNAHVKLGDNSSYESKVEKVAEAERKRIEEDQEWERQAAIQAEREFMQIRAWQTFLLKLQGKLRGTAWDPESGPSIPFSKFWKLLEARKVNFLDYADFGEHVAVILPYYKDKEQTSEEGSKNVQTDKQVPGDPAKSSERDIIFKRHVVQRMPVDNWTDIWRRLHQQLLNVEISNSNSLPRQIYPTFETTAVWGMRLLLAVVIFLWVDKKLSPFYRIRNPDDRWQRKRPKLDTVNMELGSLGQSRARFISAEESTGVTFEDFAGQEYVKRELQEVVKILKQNKEFEDLGVYCPKGVLLYGPPGTGKTLLAKAIAGEAGVPFFSASGSEFVEMFVGVAAARVRDLFTRARQFAPSIVFIDEIDAIGAKRGGPDVGGGGVEREQGLIQILTELDGFQSIDSQVVVVGATNRLDMLDPALLRKGRFDKTISIGLPTEEGRLAILKVHARNKAFNSEQEKETLLKELAALTYEFSGAELQNILNEAAILAARKDKDTIEREELFEALRRQQGTFTTGEEDVLDVTGEAKVRLAYREASIAVLECYFPNPHRPFTKTNIRDMDTYPNMEYDEPRHRVFARKKDIVDSIVRACAPRIVEEQIFGKDNLSWISGSYLSQAAVIADYLILKSGMTALGKVYYNTQRDVMFHLGPKIQALRDAYMRYAVEKCSSVLEEYRSALETIADRLLEKMEIDAAEVWEIFRKAPRIPQPEVLPVDEYEALIYVGRWGIHGASLPGRVTFKPGNLGFATFGAPRPTQVKIISDDTWRMMDKLTEARLEELRQQLAMKEEKVSDVILSPQFL